MNREDILNDLYAMQAEVNTCLIRARAIADKIARGTGGREVALAITQLQQTRHWLRQEPIPDPFVRGRVIIGWRDLLRSVFRGRLTVEMKVSGDMDRVNEVLQLDANTLLPDSTRHVLGGG